MNIGVVGTGAFARFSVNAFLNVEGVFCTGTYDTDKARVGKFAKQFNAPVFESFEQLIHDQRIDLVYISTPPFLHWEQSKASLLAGKHVICEKPAALEVHHAEELIRIAKTRDLLYVVNLMQRYNPLYSAIDIIIKEKILGEFLHGFFENYASGESIYNENSWFWDESKSGGIFIEHAVHFFDMFEGWLGKGEVVASQKLRHFGFEKDHWSQVQSNVKYSRGSVNFYHGFTQPGRLDRQEIRLLFERGDISLFEWVPVKTRLHGLVNTDEQKRLIDLFPQATIDILYEYHGEDKQCFGHFNEYSVDREIILNDGRYTDKQPRYQFLVEEMIRDQKKWIEDPDHKRTIGGNNGLNSLIMAVESEKKAIKL